MTFSYIFSNVKLGVNLAKKGQVLVNIKGELIRQLREDKNLTLVELSQKAGLSVSYISEIERGSKKPSLKTLEKIARALNIPRGQLVEMNEDTQGISMGEKVRLLREQKSITLSDFAEKVEISHTYLSDIERGVVCPAVATIRKLASELEIPVSALMTHESSVGHKLRIVREEQGMTQLHLAQLAGLSAGLIGQIEHGRVQPSLKTLEKIANALGISPCFFVVENEGLDEMLPAMSQELKEMLMDANVQSILRMVCNLNKKELQFILNFVQLFKKSRIMDDIHTQD